MRLVIDLQALQTGSKFRGIGRYARSLARALLRCKGGHEILIAVRNGPDTELEEIRSYFSDILLPNQFVVLTLFDGIQFSNQANGWQREISESVRCFSLAMLRPDFVLTAAMIEGYDDAVATSSRPHLSYRNCTIVYDLIPFHNPENYIGADVASRWYVEKLTEILHSDVLFCISDFTTRDFLENFDFPADHVHSISAASEYRLADTTPGLNDVKILRKLKIKFPYLFFAGSLEPRKNPEVVLRAFALLPKKLRATMKIVFAGSVSKTDRERIEDVARALNIKPEATFVFLGFISELQLACLYRNCAIFVFPSFSEGFGLPVLEAMACGAPTLSSDRTSLPEVVGRDDMLFDPTDPTELCGKIRRVLENPQYRAEIVQYGLVRSRQFSWDRSARQVIGALERHLSARKPTDAWVFRSRGYFDYLRTVNALAEIFDRYDVDETGRHATAQLLQTNIRSAMEIASAQLPDVPSWRIEGPFDSSYSLALVNRETARALALLGVDVSLYSTEGPGDFDPNPMFLQQAPDLDRMYQRGRDADARFTVVSRILYPPRVTRMNGGFNLLHHYACEEAGFPRDWIENFNAGLNAFTCMSRHVRKIMIDHGLRLPMAVTGIGVEHWDRVEAAPHFQLAAKSYRFLHVSSCFPRKGVDCLLKAYGNAFRRHDDVSLIIKTFPNPHNTVKDDLAKLRAEDADFPDVVIIEGDLSDGEIKALYRVCNVLVAPSRAEGFGLPVAEASLEGLPVIVTGWSGFLDFCTPDTAWLVDYELQRAQTHQNIVASVWAEPSVTHLAELLKKVRAASPDELRAKNEAAVALLRKSFTWAHVAWRLQSYIADQLSFSERTRQAAKVGWVTTWNKRCGIATHSQYLLGTRTDVAVFASMAKAALTEDGHNVTRNWTESAGDLDALFHDVQGHGCNVIVVQFNYGLFVFSELKKFLQRLIEHRKIIVFEVHATHEIDPDESKRLVNLVPELLQCDRVLVHSIGDMNRLKEMGVNDNVTLFPAPYGNTMNNPIDARQPRAQFLGRRIIASYGFFLPSKGLIQLVEAFAQLVGGGFDGHLLLANAEFPDVISRDLILSAKELVSRLNIDERVTFVNDFLPDAESLSYLRGADLVVMPYQESTTDSASGAVRLCLASGRPVAVTPLSIFDEVDSAVLRLPGCSVADLVVGIADIMADIEANAPRITAAVDAAKYLVSAMSYDRMSARFLDMIESLHINRKFDVFLGKATPELIVTLPVRPQVFSPVNGLIKTQIGRLDDQERLHSDGRSGILTFGPYALIRPGKYRLRAFGKLMSSQEGKVHFRIVSSFGEKILHELTVSDAMGCADDCLFDMRFETDHIVEGVEFVLAVDDGVPIFFSSYLLEISDATSAPSRDVHLLDAHA